MTRFGRHAAVAATLAAGAVHAQGLPDSFEAVVPVFTQPAEVSLLKLASPPVQQRISLGAAHLEAGAAKAWYTPFGWARRSSEGEVTQTLQVQSDGPKRISTPAGSRSGLSDLLATATWERSWPAEFRASGGVGVLLHAKGAVGSREPGVMLSGGLDRRLSSRAGGLSLNVLTLQFADEPAPGLSPTLVRGELRWAVSLAPATLAIGAAKVRQGGAPAVGEVQAALQWPMPRGDWRLRLVHQQVDGAAARRTAGLTYALKL